MPLIRHRRAPCGARPFLVGNYFHTHFISIHAPLAGRDFLFIRRTSAPSYFNPRAPCGARRRCFQGPGLDFSISIHAPLAGRDGFHTQQLAFLAKFQSTRPLRGATWIILLVPFLSIFQSTRPLRGATAVSDGLDRRHDISIHAPLAGRDVWRLGLPGIPQHFNPRAPCGARRASGP